MHADIVLPARVSENDDVSADGTVDHDTRTDIGCNISMRPLYIVEKIFATFGVFSLIYLITEHYIMPFTPKAEDSMLKSFVNLALPMVVNYLL